MVLAVSDSSGTRNVSWAPCPAVVTSGWTVTWAEALTAVPITTVVTSAPTAAARRVREAATEAGRTNRMREMTVMSLLLGWKPGHSGREEDLPAVGAGLQVHLWAAK